MRFVLYCMTMQKPPDGESLAPPPLTGTVRAQGKLTDALISEVAQHVARGVTKSDAAAAVGIPRQTLYGWLRRGRDLLADGKTAGPMSRLATAVDHAEAHCRAWLIDCSNRAVAGDHRVDARHIQWRLAVSAPLDYQLERLGQATADGEAVQALAGPELVASLEAKLMRFLDTQDATATAPAAALAAAPVSAPAPATPEDTIQ